MLIFVTGAASGLGLATALALVGAGHAVVAHARNPSRIDERSFPQAVYADLANLDETVALAEAANAYGRFDAVIHNAGVLDSPDVLAVNIVAPFVLTALMHKPGRLIYLSSGMHRSASGLKILDGLAGRASYSDTKLYVTALALALANRWPDTVSHAVDPGWVPTRMGGPRAPDDLEAGHTTQVWLATATSGVDPPTGGYWYHHKAQRPHSAAQDPAFQSELIAALQARTGITLPGG